MLKLSRQTHITLLLVISSLLFLPFLGFVHLFDWDEINFAECAREMLAGNDYSNVKINFQSFWEKPPLFIWMQALSMKLFGVNEFAARLPNAICGIVTVISVYNIGSKIFSNKLGFLWALSYLGSLLPFLYFKSGIIDPWFNLFIFLAIYHAVIHSNDPQLKSAMLAAFFIGLATLTKGPAAVLIFGLCIAAFYVKRKFTPFTNLKSLLAFAIVFLLTAGSWFLYEIASGNLQLVKDFFIYQVRLFKTEDAGHGGFFGYHFVVLLVGCFPASVFMIRGLKKSGSDTPFQKHFKTWMLLLFFTVLILFSIVETKIVHYSSLCYFPLTFLAAYAILKLSEGELKLKRWMSLLLAFIALILGAVMTLLPLAEKFKTQLFNAGIINDRFVMDALSVNAGWQGWEFLIGVGFMSCTLFFVLKISKQQFRFVPALFLTTALSVFLFMLFCVPKIESYTQGPAIEFYKSTRSKHCFVETVKFKSFAPLFYGERMPWQYAPEQLQFYKTQMAAAIKENRSTYTFSHWSCSWMMDMNAAIDRPAYFVMKSTDESEFNVQHPGMEYLYRKGGFVFYRRNVLAKKP